MVRGKTVSEISRLAGRDRKTIRRLLQQGGSASPKPRQVSSKLDPFREYLLGRALNDEDPVSNAEVLYDEIRAQGYEGGRTILKEFLKPFRNAQYAGREVWVRQTETRLLNCDRDQVVAEHALAERPYERRVIRAHFDGLAARRDRRHQMEVDQALARATKLALPVGPEVEKRSLAVYEALV